MAFHSCNTITNVRHPSKRIEFSAFEVSRATYSFA